MPVSTISTLAQGIESLERLLTEIEGHPQDWNEAETRFHLIDRLIVDCLGWPREVVHPEKSLGRTFADYELGTPRQVIWEAKKEGRTFELPAGIKHLSDIRSILALGGEAEEAIVQVQQYCASRGVEVAVATNGPQLIAFLATRRDGVAPMDGRCMVINGFDDLRARFAAVWQCLSPAGIKEARLSRMLNVGNESVLPQKLSALLPSYPRYRYPSALQTSLRSISELLLIDLVGQPDVEKEFFEQCYCESGALSQHALVSKSMLAARYAALFDPKLPSPQMTSVTGKHGSQNITPEVMAEAISQRPIVLLGDVGVGKSSFLKHLMYVSAYEEFQHAIYIYIDLGSKGALSTDLRDFVLREVERQLLDKHHVDIYEDSFVTAIYNLEVNRFERGINKRLKDSDPKAYELKLIEHLEEKTKDVAEHTKNAIHHLAMGRRKQVIIIIDNADQRNYQIQQEAFIIAQNFAKDWHAAVFIAIRPQTFYRSKQSGALTAYPHRVFTISPPRVDQVVEKRLVFALNMAEGKIRVDKFKEIELKLDNIALFLKALLYSLNRNNDLVEFLSNISGGNIRAIIEFVAKFFGNANINAEKIIDIMYREGRYQIPVHEFWKAALLGEFSYYDPLSSIAVNIFDIYSPSASEHFLMPMLLAYLDADGKHRSKEGFVESGAMIREMQGWGFSVNSIEWALRKANNRKLIETSERVTFDEDEAGLYGDLPASFRIGTIGAYHLKRWMAEFSYIDAMAFDTPILDDDVRTKIAAGISSFEIDRRLERAGCFKSYLIRSWNNSSLSPYYFDLPAHFAVGDVSFDRVRSVVAKSGSPRA